MPHNLPVSSATTVWLRLPFFSRPEAAESLYFLQEKSKKNLDYSAAQWLAHRRKLFFHQQTEGENENALWDDCCCDDACDAAVCVSAGNCGGGGKGEGGDTEGCWVRETGPCDTVCEWRKSIL
jgi:hypothetical protein